MNTNRGFLIGFYLTLGMALACLTQAEAVFLPGIYWLALPVSLLLVLAYALEGRWHLSVAISHCLGVLLAVGSALWIAYHFLRPASSVVDNAPWPVAILPYLGPILMLLSLAKLFRPKNADDYWLLYTIGLMQVTLACVLTYEATFGLLLFAYVAAALWSLGEFHRAREEAGAVVVEVPGRDTAISRLGLGSAAWLALRVVGLALVIFLMMPHLADSHWDPITMSRTTVLTSGGVGETVDLNRVGSVRMSPRVAFEVDTQDEWGWPGVMSSAQRFRGVALVRYQQGRWSGPVEPRIIQKPTTTRTVEPPLAAAERRLTLHVDVLQTRGLLVAEPAALDGDDSALPITCREPVAPPTMLFRAGQGSITPSSTIRTGRYVYEQRTSSEVPRPRSADFEESQLDRTGYLKQNAPRVRYVTARVLRRLARQGVLSTDDFSTSPDDFQITVDRSRHRAVASALEEFLSSSGDYTYSLRLRRTNTDLDPVEDFLLHVKSGHCELYATALVLQLRTCGIPARLVRGYVGGDPDPDLPGRFLVRQSMAHAWVEALFDSESQPGKVYWQTLDPTPAQTDSEDAGLPWIERWWSQFTSQSEGLWRNYVVEYTAEQRDESARAAWNWITTMARRSSESPANDAANSHSNRGNENLWLALVTAGLVLATLLATWWWGRRRHEAPTSDEAGYYERWLLMLARRFQLRPTSTQTAREFAREADLHLGPRPGDPIEHTETRPVAEHVAVVRDRERFGGRPASPDEIAEIDQQRLAIDSTPLHNRRLAPSVNPPPPSG